MRPLAVLAVVLGTATALAAPAIATAPRAPSLSPTQSTFTIPAGSTSSWTLRLWSHGSLEGSDSATSGILTVAVPATTDCAFQADVLVVPVGGHSSYYSGRRATVPGCGPLPTIAGDIYSCPATGATTSEVPGGTLEAAGPQTLPSQANPMAPISVLSGTYTMTAASPPGYMFVACGGSATVSSSGTSATEVVPVFIGDTGGPLATAKTASPQTVSGGGGVGIFYVTTTPVPVGARGATTDPAGSGLTTAQTSVGPALAAGAATQAAVPLAATPVASGSLAFTGMNIGPLLLAGLLSLTLGTLLLASTRVRRRPSLVGADTRRVR